MENRRLATLATGFFVVSAFLMASPALAQQPAPVAPDNGGARSGLRIALQGRIGVINTLIGPEGTGVPGPLTPFATGGVRLLDERLFLGLGFGFASTSRSECGGMGCDNMKTTTSTSAWSLSPLASFDLLTDSSGRGVLYVVGWFNFGESGGQSVEIVTPGRTTTTDTSGTFFWGLNVAAGLRANLVHGLAIGTEWGWGFVTSSHDNTSVFGQAFFGTILFEGSIGV